ncbi:hypothetical protein IQ274_25435 [Nostoc sp. LEGE 12447]|uniref:hypothetical protein n=1 Tax=Nostoc sp. LEGE 12447 TaxID=1828640 RepID=UPI0018835673|nr:hypothetical protein [Nostoc sp. LEGE 12447]MBE9001466.1 hypothetical protein [Nostoc sp. LEGE 12447]
MQNFTNFPSLIDRWLRYEFQTILVVCFLLWTPLLVIETLQIQHSCHPMIHWSGTLPAECQPKALQLNSSSSKKPKTRRDRSQEQKQIAKSDRSPSPKPSSTPQRQIPSISPPSQSPETEDVLKIAKEHSDITGGVIGIGVASFMAVIGGVPLAVAVGIGAVVWLAIKTVL